MKPTRHFLPYASVDNAPAGCAPVASSIQATYDKMSDLMLIEISLGHDEPGTDKAKGVVT